MQCNRRNDRSFPVSWRKSWKWVRFISIIQREIAKFWRVLTRFRVRGYNARIIQRISEKYLWNHRDEIPRLILITDWPMSRTNSREFDDIFSRLRSKWNNYTACEICGRLWSMIQRMRLQLLLNETLFLVSNPLMRIIDFLDATVTLTPFVSRGPWLSHFLVTSEYSYFVSSIFHAYDKYTYRNILRNIQW